MEFCDYIKELRINNKKTQLEISLELGVDQSTYAHYESGRRTPDLDKLRHLAQYYGLIDELLGSSGVNPRPLYGKYYKFPVLFDSPIDLARIYPTKQATAIKLYDILHTDERVVSAMLFGSSVTMHCNKNSDTDVSVRLQEAYINRETKNDISEKILEVCDWKADIIWYDTLSNTERIYKEICKGVQIA